MVDSTEVARPVALGKIVSDGSMVKTSVSISVLIGSEDTNGKEAGRLVGI